MRAALLLATAAADFQLLPIAPPLTTLTNLKTDPTDVFVCSWPKSGTTWMPAIVAHLVAPVDIHVFGIHVFGGPPRLSQDASSRRPPSASG